MSREELLEEYTKNEMSKLKTVCKPLFTRFGFPQSYNDDFYSIALEVLWSSSESFDEEHNTMFKTYLQKNIARRYNTFIRDMNRDKRIPLGSCDSFDEINELTEKVSSYKDEFAYLFEEDYTDKADLYLSKLSRIERNVVLMLSDGFSKDEIMSALHINCKQYADALTSIHKYENVKLLY